MSDDDKRAQDRLEQIETRADEWARSGEYNPLGTREELAESDVVFLLAHIAGLEDELRAARAFAPRALEGDGSGLPFGSVVIDCDGDAWQRDRADGWSLAGESRENTPALRPGFAPYTIVYTPGEEES